MANAYTYPERVEVMGVPIDPFTMKETVSKANDYIVEGSFAHFIGVNAAKLLQMRESAEMNEIVQNCELINADGSSMVIAAKVLGVDMPARVAGIDLMYELCKLAEQEKYSVYLLGAKQSVVERSVKKIEQMYPALRVGGFRNGYFEPTEIEVIAEDISTSCAKIIFVGITSPKKELIIEQFRSLGVSGVFVGVGGSFDVVSGDISRAPKWMQSANLEWAFRMIKEPKRLAKRYLIGNARFITLLAEELIAGKMRKSS